jgi:DNA-binding NarL/FixJ family response regulator
MMNDDKLKSLPVVVLTTSGEGEEILKLYKMRCSSYIVKPIDFDQFLKVVRTLAEYWFTVVVLPTAVSTDKAIAQAGAKTQEHPPKQPVSSVTKSPLLRTES